MHKPLVCFHKYSSVQYCLDGLFSAAAAYHFLREDAEYRPLFHSKEVSIENFDFRPFKGRDVYMLDFCYDSKEIMDAIAACCNLVVIDHHDSTFDLLHDYSSKNLVFDKTVSAALATYRYFAKYKPPESAEPLALLYVSDYDTWERKYVESDVLALLVGVQSPEWDACNKDYSVPNAIVKAEELFSQDVLAESLTNAFPLLQQRDSYVSKICSYALPITLLGIEGVMVNNTFKEATSFVAEALLEKCPTFAMLYHIREDWTVEVSLRSSGKNAKRRLQDVTDVKAIAENFGGGGHVTAAGFSVPFTAFTHLILPQHGVDSVNWATYRRSIESSLIRYVGWYVDNYKLRENQVELLAQNLSQAISTLYPEIAAGLRFSVNLTHKRWNDLYKTPLHAGIARLLLKFLPQEETVPKWYHAFLPYKIDNKIIATDSQICDLLELSSAANKEDCINNFLNAIPKVYRAYLPYPKPRYLIQVWHTAMKELHVEYMYSPVD